MSQAAAESIKMWDELFQKLDIQLMKPGIAPVHKTWSEDLDAFEERHGFFLPESYREFVMTFGPGNLGGPLTIFAPGYAGHRHADLDRLNHTAEKRFASSSFYADDTQSFIRGLCYFGDTWGGDLLGWDLGKQSPAGECDESIWIVPRDHSDPEIEAESFAQLVQLVVNGEHTDPVFYCQSVSGDSRSPET